MIDAQFVAPSRITLRGHCLALNYPSRITRYSNGWEVRLEFKPCESIPMLVKDQLPVTDVLAMVLEMLENWHVTEEVNTAQIGRYIVDQENRVQESADRIHREMARG